MDELQVLQQQISALEAAVEELNFECEKFQILNFNMELQLTESNQELSHNIVLLQQAQEENERLQCALRTASTKVERLVNIDEIIATAHEYAQSILNAAHIGATSDTNKIEDTLYVNQINDLLGKLTSELDKASSKIIK